MPSRRQALRAGSLVAAALAGCLGASSDTTTTDTTTTTATTTTADTTTDETTDDATETTPDGPDALQWTLDADGGFEHPPVVADGTVYAGADALHAVSTDGTEQWRFDGDEPVQARPLVRDSGVYVVTGSLQGSPAGEKFAAHVLDRDGSRRWTYAADHGMVSVLDATPDSVYVGTHDDYLQDHGESLAALDAAGGDQQWTVEIGDANGGVAVGDAVVAAYRLGVAAFDPADGTQQWEASARSLGGVAGDAAVVVGESSVRALAVADGAEQWTFSPSAEPSSAAVIGDAVYVGTRGGTLHAVDATSGDERWQASVGGKGYDEPVVAHGTVYAAGDGVVALDAATGETRWRVETPRARLAAGSNGVYAATLSTLRALDPDDGSERWRYDADGRLSPPVAAGGRVYVGDESGTLAAFRA